MALIARAVDDGVDEAERCGQQSTGYWLLVACNARPDLEQEPEKRAKYVHAFLRGVELGLRARAQNDNEAP